MDPKTLIIVVVAVIVLAVIAWALVRRQRSAGLRRRFGPEYERAVREHGPAHAESLHIVRR